MCTQRFSPPDTSPVKHHLAALCVSLVLLGHASPAQWQSVGNMSGYRTAGPGRYVFSGGEASVEVQVLADDLLRVRLAHGIAAQGGSAESLFSDIHSWAVVRTSWPEVRTSVVESEEAVSITTDRLELIVRRAPLRLAVRDRSGNLISEDHPGKGMGWSGAEVRVWKSRPADEFYYGFGEKAGYLERGESHMTMWNSDIPGYTPGTDPLYKAVPFFYGVRKGKAYGIFLDNTWWTSFDMGKEARDQYSFGAEAGDLVYYFMYGPAPEHVLARFTELVGRTPLPPRWSLGYQQCRWSYTPESRVREIARGFRERSIPCDVIYLDIDYMDGYRIFTWNPKSFPEPASMVRELAKEGFRVAVIVDPGIKADTSYAAYRRGLSGDHFVRYPDGRLFTGTVWPGVCAFPDFTRASTRMWWGEELKVLTDVGIRGWWNDMNEPSVFDGPGKTIDLAAVHDDQGRRTPHAKNHNIYGMQMTRATYEGVRRHVPAERPFLLTRATYAGGQRYSAVWTGDNVASWEHLQLALTMCLNLSISGHSFVGADIGGFIGFPSGELFARWLQLGVFTPLMRAHSVINERNKEPWEYGPEYTSINRETINLRYRLLPYIYTQMYVASTTGLPPMRPMVFTYPEDGRFVWEDSQFMFGRDLLVAPVLSPQTTAREVKLPGGLWYDYWSGDTLGGSRTVTRDAPASRIPLLVRAGAVIPTQPVMQHTGEARVDPLTLSVYLLPEGRDSSLYYEDDGLTFDAEKGGYFRRYVSQRTSQDVVEITLTKAEGSYIPGRQVVHVRLIGLGARPRGVFLGGAPLPEAGRADEATALGRWSYDSTGREVILRVAEDPQARVIRIRR